MSNRVKRAAGGLYAWFWFHTEIWLSPEGRRPYTYIFRDLYHDNPLLVLLVAGGLFYCIGRWWVPVRVLTFVIGFFGIMAGCLLGHLFWGGKWVPGQQEDPTYNPGAKKRSYRPFDPES